MAIMFSEQNVIERKSMIPLGDIVLDNDLQPRDGLDEETVERYADVMAGGTQMPDVVLFYDGRVYWLADGWHRHEAARRLKRVSISAEVHRGTRHHALLYALSANTEHGLQRRPGDLRRAVELALGDADLSRESDRQIAQIVRCSNSYVSRVRRELAENLSVNSSQIEGDQTRIVRRGGQVYEQKVKEAEPEPTESEIDAARNLVAHALSHWKRPAFEGDIHNQVQRDPDGGAGTTLKAVKAAIKRMIEAGNVVERQNDHGKTVYALADSPAAQPGNRAADEMNAQFDQTSITILGCTDDGAWHRAIEIGRKLVAAGVWDGQEPIQFNAYMLHDKLFGVNAVEPKDLANGPGEDYRIFDARAGDLQNRILALMAGGPKSLSQLRDGLDIALSDQEGMRVLRETLDLLVNGHRVRRMRDLYIPVKPNDATPPPPANTWAQTRALPDRILETLAAAPLPLEILCDRLEMTGPVQRDQVQGTLCILQIDNRVQELRGMWSVAGEELPADSGEDWLDTEVERPTPAQKDGERILEVLRKYHSSPLGFLFIRTETGLDEADFDRARNYLLSAKLAVQDGKTLKLAPQPKPEPQPDPPIDVVEVNGNGNIHFSSDSEEWYTPADIVERVIQVLTGIDLDPCSNSQEAPNVPAAMHYTKEEDGLAQEWHGKVFLNSPYGRTIPQWIDKLVSEYEAGRVTQAIALVPARTDTVWFAALRDFPRCFVQGRITFLKPDGSKADPAPFPSALVYLGPDVDQFAKVFADLGDIYVRYQAPKAEGGDVSV